MHVSTHYQDFETNTKYPNHTMYLNSIGKHPERVKNMHMLYALIIRSVNLIYDQLADYNFESGLCEEKDEMTSLYMMDLMLKTLSHC